MSSPTTARLFGNFALSGEDGASLLPSGRKSRAIVACLMLAGDEGMSRERLAALLWSRSGEEQARASLRQALYDLRALAAGDAPAIGIDRAGARVHPGRIVTDLDLLRAAQEGSDASSLADALGDEPQELLSDLNGIDEAFDEWLRNERIRRGDARRTTLLAVAHAALGTGDARGAQRLASALLTTNPTDEAAARVAMQACRQQADRDGVRQVFARLEAALKSELDTGPAADTLEVHRASMVDPVEPRPMVANVQTAQPAPPRQSEAIEGSGPAAASSPHVSPSFATLPAGVVAGLRRYVPAAVSAIVLTIALATGAGWYWQHSARAAVPRLLLVAPLATDSSDAAAHALAAGFPADLARMLVGNDPTLAVVDPDGPKRPAQRKSDLIVTGDATSDAGMLRVNVKLRRASDPAIAWSTSFARPSADAAALRDEIANRVAGVIVCSLGGKRPAPDDFDTQTMQLYLGACEQKYGDWAQAAKLLQQVVERRPDYAHGWAMLAAGTSTSAYFRPALKTELHEQAKQYAKHALELDLTDGEAYFAQADALPGIEHWAERMAILDAGHAADPTNASVNGSRGNELAKVGRWHEAIAAVQQAVDAEPFSPVQVSTLARLRGFDVNAEAAEPALAIGRAHFPLVGYFARTEFRIAALVGDPRRATAILDDPRYRIGRSPEMTAAWKALIEARIDPSPTRIEMAVQRIRDDAVQSQDLMPSIQKLMALNRVHDAYALAASLTERADNGGQEILFSRLLAPLRADPRFMTLATRMGIVSIWLQSGRWPDFCDEKTLGYDCRVEAKRAMSPQARPL